MTKNFTIGIDLGTTYSCVGIWENDRPEIIANNYGDRTTPSCVIFTNDGQLIGEDVIDYLNIDPKNIISSVKRMMGKNFIDELLQSDIKRWPFKVIEKNNGKPYIQVNYKNEIKDFSPEEISAMILSKMKEIAEYYIGQEVTNAVITVPAFFNNAQREATKKAGEIAGLNILRIVNEPTAAAIAYSFDKLEPNDNINILVVDLGGGTFDVTLLNVNNKKFEVLASSGDTHLGGDDFDNRLVDYFVKEFQEKFKIDLTTNPKAMRRLKAKCESIKHKLSSSQKVKIYIDRLYDSIDFSSSITRSKFEEINMDLFKRIIKPFDDVIKDSGLKKSDIHKIVLVGGSCRIPKIQSLISEYFDRKDLSKNINSEEAVAQGATILSAYLSGINSDKINDIVLNEKIPFSLGVEVNEGIMYPLIESNTPIPTSKSKVFTTMRDNQTGICCKVYEGERLLTKGNNLLGEFKLTDITPSSHGKPKIKITFNIDENGILNASAMDISTGKYSKIKIDYNKEVLSTEKKEQIINDAEKYKEEDKIEILRIRTRYNLEMYASDLLTLLNDPNIKSKIRKSSFNNFEKKIKSTINWIKNHQNESQKEYKKIKLELKNIEHSIKSHQNESQNEYKNIILELKNMEQSTKSKIF